MAGDFLQERYADEVRRMHGVYLAGAASAIAFAFHQTSDRDLEWPLSATLLAVLLWGSSFASGILANHHLRAGIRANIAVHFAENARRGDWKKQAEGKFSAANKAAGVWSSAQLWLLLAGACAYLIGHIWYLAERAPHDASTTVTPAAPSPASPAQPTVVAPNPAPAPQLATPSGEPPMPQAAAESPSVMPSR